MKKILISSVVVGLLATSSLFAKTYATVDGVEITDDDISVIIRNPQIKMDQLPVETQKQVVNQAIERKLLAISALKSGVQNETEYKEALEKVKESLALELWMQKELKAQKVSDSDAKDFYTKNLDKFKQPATVKAKHILVKEESEAKAIIELLDKASDKVAEFEKLAKEKSTGPSGKNGGELGWFDAKKMVPEFSTAAFALKKGDYTKTPVKTQFGYHIILTEDKKEKETVAFDKVKEKLIFDLKREKFGETIKKIAGDLKKTAKIVIK